MRVIRTTRGLTSITYYVLAYVLFFSGIYLVSSGSLSRRNKGVDDLLISGCG